MVFLELLAREVGRRLLLLLVRSLGSAIVFVCVFGSDAVVVAVEEKEEEMLEGCWGVIKRDRRGGGGGEGGGILYRFVLYTVIHLV